MEADIVRQIDQAKKALENTVKMVSELKDLDNHENFLETYAGLVENLLTTEHNLNVHSSTFQMARNAQTIPEFDAAYSRGIMQSQGESIKNTAQYREMMEMAKDYFTIASGGDIATTNTTLDDDLAIEENILTVDPLTKGPLENPVKNRICGHVYGKNTIEQAIKRGNIRCPYLGCSNKENVALSHLVEDHKLKMQLAAIRAKAQADMEQDDSEEE